MGTLGRSVGWVHLLPLLLAGGCAGGHPQADSARVSSDTTHHSTAGLRGQPEDDVPDKLLTVGESAAPDDGFANLSTTYLPPVPADDSVLERARLVLAAAKPGFREWPPTKYAPVSPRSAGPQTTRGPLAGDFDGDGMPDVVFDGYDGDTAVTTAVLSNKGRPTVVLVYDAPGLPDPRTRRGVGFAVVSYTLNRERGFGVGFVYYLDSGAVVEGPIYVYRDGRFTPIVVGE